MKTSTKFLIAYIFLALTTTLVMFILSKKLLPEVDQSDFMQQKSELPPFSVIVAMGNTEFHIEGAETNSLVWKVSKKNPNKWYKPKFFVQNDTLFVQKTDSSLSFNNRMVISSKSLKAVVTTHRDNVELRKLNREALLIQNTKSQVVINNWYDEKYKHLQKVVDLTVEATDSSEMTFYNVKIGKFSARLSHYSEYTSREYVSIRVAEVKLSDHSTATFEKAPFDLRMVRDSSSWSNIWR